MTIFLNPCDVCADCNNPGVYFNASPYTSTICGSIAPLTGGGPSVRIRIYPPDANIQSVTFNGVEAIALRRTDITGVDGPGAYRDWSCVAPGAAATCLKTAVQVTDTSGNLLTWIGAPSTTGYTNCIGCPDDCKLTGVQQLFTPVSEFTNTEITIPAQAYYAVFGSDPITGDPEAIIVAQCGNFGAAFIVTPSGMPPFGVRNFTVYTPSGGVTFLEV